MASSPQASAGLARSIGSGRVFARFEFDTEQVNKFVTGLNYASTQGAIADAVNLRDIGQKVLDEVKRSFPDDKPDEFIDGERITTTMHLKDGWRVSFYDAVSSDSSTSSAPSLLGFVINHRQQQNKRVRTILASLESGSRAHTIHPVHAKALRFAGMTPGGHDSIVFADHADIPAREGIGYLRKAQVFADQLLASRQSQMEKELVSMIEKGGLVKRRLTNSSFDRDATTPIESVISAGPIARPRNMLKSGRVLKKKISSRLFSKSFR